MDSGTLDRWVTGRGRLNRLGITLLPCVNTNRNLNRAGSVRFHSLLAPFLAAAVLSTCLSCAAQNANASLPAEPNQLPTLTTARAAHSLSSKEASRAYPVHLRAVVTYFDPGYSKGRISIFVHDRTGSIYASAPFGSMGPVPVGSLVDITGVSQVGGFAPVIANARIHILGKAPLPRPDLKVSYSELVTGSEDGTWVQAEGTVHSVILYPYTVTLVLSMVDGTVSVTMMRDAGATYSQLVDAKIRILAHAAPTVNTNSQMVGAHLMAPNLSTVTILEPAPPDAFGGPVVPVDDLLRWSQVAAWTHRVHVRGTVTLQWPGSFLCIRDATGAICAKTLEQTHVNTGDVVDIAGFAGAEDDAPVLTHALFRVAGALGPLAGGPVDAEPVSAEPVSAEQALLGKLESNLIQIDGRIIGRDMNASDVVLLLSSGKFLFTAVLPKSLAGTQAEAWAVGSTVKVTGICSVQLDLQSNVRDGVGIAKTFRVLLRSPGDVTILQQPSWWTPVHAVLLLGLALIATLAVLLWVAILRRRLQHQAALLREQTELLRESEEQFRHMALHDPLTGLATRILLQDRFEAAIEATRRYKTGIGVLMVDLDQFKQINDTFGHPTGDEVLCVTASRLLEAVRKGDTVARVGGDEFVVLLAGLQELEVAEKIAANLVTTLAAPISLAIRDVPVSVSIGVCVDSAGTVRADALLDGADAALYFAKDKCRNCYHFFTPDLFRSASSSEAGLVTAK